MSINHLIDPNTQIKLDIACNSCNCESMKVFDKLEVKDFIFDSQNGDPIELSTLPDQGVMGSVLKSDGGGGVIWGSDLTGGVNYTGSLPTVVNGLTVYNGLDGTTLGDTALTTQDIIDLQNDKLNKDGTNIMTGNLQLGGNTITGVNNITAIGSIAGNIAANSIRGLLPGQAAPFTEDINLNSNDIKNAENVYTNNLYSKAGLGLIKVNNGGIDFQTTNNIFNVNNLETQEIKSTNGVSVRIQDDLDMGVFDINNCNDIKTNNLSTNTAPNIVSNNNIDMNTNDLLDVGNMNVSKINNITPVGGLYSGYSDGTTITQAMGSTDLLPLSSVGGLSIPANGFSIGDAFHMVCSGIFPSESKSDTVDVELCALLADTSTVVLGSISVDLEAFDTQPSNFELESDFVVRSVGITGEISVSFDFTFNKKVTKDFKGTRATNIAVIDMTQSSTLQLNATITGGGGSTIKSTLAYLRKQY